MILLTIVSSVILKGRSMKMVVEMEDLLARMEAAETVKAYMELDPRAIRDKIYWNTQDGSEPETEKEKASKLQSTPLAKVMYLPARFAMYARLQLPKSQGEVDPEVANDADIYLAWKHKMSTVIPPAEI